MSIEVVVASESKHKIAAAQAAFSEVFSNQVLNIFGVPASSDINEQPFGIQETLQGAFNRLLNAQIVHGTRFDYLLAMENGIFQMKERPTSPARNYDFAWVVLMDRNYETYMTHSAGVEFDGKYVAEAMKRGFSQTTVGAVMAEMMGISSTDPHSALTNLQVSRAEILKQAIKITLGQQQAAQKE